MERAREKEVEKERKVLEKEKEKKKKKKKKWEKMWKEWSAEKERPQLWYRATARCLGLKPKDVKATVECMMAMAAYHMEKHGSFKLAGYINMKLKVRPAKPARKGVNPFTRTLHLQHAASIEDRATAQEPVGHTEGFAGIVRQHPDRNRGRN